MKHRGGRIDGITSRQKALDRDCSEGEHAFAGPNGVFVLGGWKRAAVSPISREGSRRKELDRARSREPGQACRNRTAMRTESVGVGEGGSKGGGQRGPQ